MQQKIDGKIIQQKIIDDIGTRLFGKKVVFLQFGENLVSENFVKVKMKLAKKLGSLKPGERLSD